MNINTRLSLALVAPLALATAATSVSAQCNLLVRESFRPGPRPHGNNGRLRDAQIHDVLKDYWPQVSQNNAMWIATDQNGVPTWGFAGSSLDGAELDPLDPFNGTAFGEAPACAVLAFSAPAVPVTVSAECVQGLGTTSATYLGFTSQPALLSNFETFGTLWMTLNGSGDWSIRANGNTILASGTAPIAGSMGTGWLHMDFTYDPANHLVWGRVMDTPIAPVSVTLTRPITHLGMEAHESWNVVNNLSVFTGPAVNATVPSSVSVCVGQSATLIATPATQSDAVYYWRRTDGAAFIFDGQLASGATVAGVAKPQLTLSGVTPAESGTYVCTISNPCGYTDTQVVTLTVTNCCPADFNADGTLNPDDLGDFITCFFTEPPCAGADYNADGNTNPDDLGDFITAFFTGC